MAVALSARKEARSFGALSRLISFACAAALCALLVYLALTQRFGAITQWIDDAISFETVLEYEEPPPAPPPPQIIERSPPEAQRPTPANIDAPPTPSFDPIPDGPPAPPSPPAPAYIDATFLQRPDGADFERFYPRRALERGMSGNVVLDCTVASNGRLACAIASETPTGWGFGEASLRAAREFQVAPATADGHPTSGGRLRVPMSWRLR